MPTATPTALLKSWCAGDREALDRLVPLLYDELARIARGAMSAERRDHTLQTRALVHEAYLRLIDAGVESRDRAHFLALAARTMRRVLTDHARKRHRVKRGGPRISVPLTDSGRYAHHRDHLTDVSSASGLSVLHMTEGILRYEYGEPVEGWVAVLAREKAAAS